MWTSWFRSYPGLRGTASILPRAPWDCVFLPDCLEFGQDGPGSSKIRGVSPTLQIPFYPIVYGVGICCLLQSLVLLGDIAKLFRGNMNEVASGIMGFCWSSLSFLPASNWVLPWDSSAFWGLPMWFRSKASLNLIAKDIFDVFSSYGFTVIPLLSSWANRLQRRYAKRLFDTAYSSSAIFRGLAMATVAELRPSRPSAGHLRPRPPPSPAWPCRKWTVTDTVKNYPRESWRA